MRRSSARLKMVAMGALALGVLAPMPYPVTACTIDGKPSAFANGVRAVISHEVPTPQTYASWAHFTFPRAYRVGQRIVFREDDGQVRKLLSRADLKRSWRWRLGDGTARTGDTAAHSYRRAGRYRVSVDAYFPGYGWQAFDSIAIAIRR